jgi:hypothetical protein
MMLPSKFLIRGKYKEDEPVMMTHEDDGNDDGDDDTSFLIP